MIIAIVSVDEKYGIGKDGKLLVSHSEDMNFFKTMTTGNIVVMGRKTWDSLPKKPLPNRTNIIITSHPEKSDNIETTFTTMEDFLDNLEYLNTGEKDIYIIGGGFLGLIVGTFGYLSIFSSTSKLLLISQPEITILKTLLSKALAITSAILL